MRPGNIYIAWKYYLSPGGGGGGGIKWPPGVSPSSSSSSSSSCECEPEFLAGGLRKAFTLYVRGDVVKILNSNL
jgi:hypothetical protein